MNEKVSICIPAYKRTDFLKRLLDSILVQTYKNYEVIISDDSDDNSVQLLAKAYEKQLPISYYRNTPACGTPKNWNAAMEKATGEWIKLVHDDDWFANETALQTFMNAIKPGVRFVFSGYQVYVEKDKQYIDKTISQEFFKTISQHPLLLFASNFIGPPSVILSHRSITDVYDPNLKWCVDIEYFMRVMSKERAIYIDAPLIYMSSNDTQVTNYCFRNPEVEIPEALYVLKEYDEKPIQHLRVYDAWWRLMRNVNIRNQEQLKHYAGKMPIPKFLLHIVDHQRLIPAGALRNGFVSKACMALSYMLNIPTLYL